MSRFIGFYDYTVILTYASLLSAVSGMYYAAQGNFLYAILFLLLSGLCDAFDGAVARSKKNRTTSEKAFGIQIDSLCDAISFGVAPAVLCYFMGVDGFWGRLILFLYCLCAVIRLAFFNVLEGERQQVEEGANKYYRGLPVTAISIILPLFSLLRPVLSEPVFTSLLHLLMLAVAILFVLDFTVKKPDWKRLLTFAG
ncbi:MAG: CDP-alcohol phosphatidyltransferase family protein [Ruminiclostridium sp.]|nr:CDP-alcohol phosphatidyltransferase family protein [Ruminiclostridium sp.]